ncbi:MAG: hypothetical protein BWY74_01425 [Firmicutes bacterium ADurb.Bin419]|nr:MAG: hypothetical protein BWY74_01425 [Firmicutes bacterium ADurb.Bin419]
MIKIAFKLIRVLGIIFGFGIIALYVVESGSMISKFGFQYYRLSLGRIIDIASIMFAIILVLPFGKLKKINRVYKNTLFLYLVGFEIITCIYYIQDYEWFVPYDNKKMIISIIILTTVLIPLLNIYVFFCEVIRTNKNSNADDEVMSEFLDS